MKKILTYLIVGLFLLSACSKDYLDTVPTSAVGTATAIESTENARLVINGINKLMTRQLVEKQGFNGEGTIKMRYGNYPGNHFTFNYTSDEEIINADEHQNITSRECYYPWYYYYMIVSNANSVILNIDAATGSDKDKQFIKAQALTYRAYAFFMLSQLYCVRWMDSNNGASNGLVLRIDLSTGDHPLSTLAEVYEQIYADLDEAIRLYTESGKERDESKGVFDPNINVAYATYARAAITRQDYPTAMSMATKARDGYPLMDVADYKAGFYTPTSEWIWGSYGAPDETLHYYSYHAYIAYNADASNVRNRPKCISKQLFDRVPDTDIRKGLFLNPDGYSYNGTTGLGGSSLKSHARSLYPDMQSDAKVYAYMQFKVKAETSPGVGHLNHFRSSEMLLIEAEAKYFSKNESGAQDDLETLNKSTNRDPDYTCTATGADLLEEIKMYRALELWGEGFDWFDLKRWGDPVYRLSFADGGSFVFPLDAKYDKDSRNNWTWMIPEKETNFNDFKN